MVDASAQLKQSAINTIYQEVAKIIGAGDQLFCMTFPAQPLNQKKFQYDTSSYASVLTKPWLVEEEEFRLSDQLFDLSPIVQATNGKKLSSTYELLLNNYLPKLNELAHYFKDRAGLSGFLTEKTDEKDEYGNYMTRMELCKRLYQIYLDKKELWEQEKRDKLIYFKNLAGDAPTKAEEDAAVDEYADWHSTTAASKEAEIDNLYNDLVVRGHFHEVTTILGYLNASSIAESLEKYKQNMRHSRRVSLDESMDIYPVQYIPNNWAEALTPNLHPEDLTMAQDVLVASLRAKRKELSRLKEEMKELNLLHVNPEKIKDLEEQVNTAKETFNDAEADVVGAYGNSVVKGIKIYLDATTGKAQGLMEGIGDLVKADEAAGTTKKATFDVDTIEKLGLTLGDVAGPQQVAEMMQKAADQLKTVYKNQQAVLDDAQKLTELQAQLAQSKSQDMALQKKRLQEQIDGLEDDVDYLGAMVSGVYSQNAAHERAGTLKDNKLVKVEMTTPGVVADPDNNVTAVTAIQTITIDSNAGVTGGTFQVSFNGKLSKKIEYTIADAKLGTILSETVGDTVTVAKVAQNTGSWTVTFDGTHYENKPVPLFTIDPQNVKFTGANGPIAAVTDNRPELDVLPAKRTLTAADGLFNNVTISIKKGSASASTTQTASASQSGGGVSWWFGSAGGQSSSSNAATKLESSAFENDIDIGFRVAKVTFDRGGWFNPTLFDLACNGDFYRLSEMRAGAGITKSDLDDWTNKDLLTQVDNNLQYPYSANGKSHKGRYLLPAYPVAMIIAKDITFKITMDYSKSSDINKHAQSASSASGGFLCFHYSHAESSSSSSQTSYHGHQNSHYYIRIPGPQILGYVLELVPQDTTEIKTFPKAVDEDRKADQEKLTFLKALQDFDTYATTYFPGPQAALPQSGNGGMNRGVATEITQDHIEPALKFDDMYEGKTVEATQTIGGVIHDPKAEIWVVTHRVGSSQYDVERQATVLASGEWSASVSFGRAGTDAGKEFEVRAFANPKQTLHEDNTLPEWPEAEFSTPTIKVHRDQTVVRQPRRESHAYGYGHHML
ncbi:MAG: hypothetical protein F6K30_08480 [Cyanothece sp. SIO2G6]|nr:hypothetical protein [Cyanothece sp. SIO2G6]